MKRCGSDMLQEGQVGVWFFVSFFSAAVVVFAVV